MSGQSGCLQHLKLTHVQVQTGRDKSLENLPKIPENGMQIPAKSPRIAREALGEVPNATTCTLRCDYVALVVEQTPRGRHPRSSATATLANRT